MLKTVISYIESNYESKKTINGQVSRYYWQSNKELILELGGQNGKGTYWTEVEEANSQP